MGTILNFRRGPIRDWFSTRNAARALESDQCVQIRNWTDGQNAKNAVGAAARVFSAGDYDQNYQVANIALMEEGEKQFPLLQMIRFSPLWPIAKAYLGTPSILILLLVSYFRRVSLDRKDIAIPYHQDGLGLPEDPNLRMLSFWMLLSPESAGANSHAPGLEFLLKGPKRKISFEENPASEAFRNTQSSDTEIDAIKRAGAVPWTPSLTQGDCMLFSQWNLHRAFVGDSHDTVRFSFETRLMAGTAEAKELLRRQKSPVIEVFDREALLGDRQLHW